MENENLLQSIIKAKAKIIVLLEEVLEDPRKNIKNLNEYKQVKKLVKTLNNETLNSKWGKESRKIYNYLYDREYVLRKKEEKLNGRSEDKEFNTSYKNRVYKQ
ncbi:MAG: hypothetical protein ACRC7S_17445 [Cetobacterium sp.]